MRLPYSYIAIAAALLSSPASARADDVYFTTQSLLTEFFKTSERVTFVKVDTSAASRELAVKLGYVPKKTSYVVFVARTGAKIDGYAVIDEEMGQHQPITFGVKLSPEGAVERMEVMVYREGYGAEVREPRFRRQFEGKTAGDAIRFGDDVAAISGATISSKAMATGVRRAVALVAVMKARALDGAVTRRASDPQADSPETSSSVR